MSGSTHEKGGELAVGVAPRLVILRALGLGDLLTAVPALRALADAFPHHRRVLAAPAGLAPLAEMTAAVHEVVDTAPLRSLEPSLGGPDVAVNLHGSGPESHRVLLEARPRQLIAFAHPAVPESVDGPPWWPHEHEVHRWCRLLGTYGIAADPSRLDLPAPSGQAPAETHGATLIHPGAASGARRWPPERFAAVARAEREAGRRVVVTGGPDEVALARRVAAAAELDDEAVLAGRTDLFGLTRAVAAADRVVCGDTGVAHLATALGTSSVVLFGPTSPYEWGPPGRPRHIALWAGRQGDPHGDEPDPGLLAISADEVQSALGHVGDGAGDRVTRAGLGGGGGGSRRRRRPRGGLPPGGRRRPARPR